MKTKDYVKATNLISINLDALYADKDAFSSTIDANLKNIINAEAPLTLNTLKARFREIFGVAKISGKALDIIMERAAYLDIALAEEIFDVVLWPSTGEFNVDYLRINSDRLIYDIPACELKNLLNSYDLYGEELYRKVLAYFGLEVLTEKARTYLEYVEKY